MSAGRTFSALAERAGDEALEALRSLADSSLEPRQYGEAMRTIGEALGRCFAAECEVAGRNVYLAITVEDADFLAAGISEAIQAAGGKVAVACFWNVRQKINGLSWLDVATIADEYREAIPDQLDHLIVVKSIISGACVVKTNLMYLLEDARPQRIHIMAPVVLSGAEERLASEFEPQTAERFEYWRLAVDAEKDTAGNVLPGIGGEIYTRLGFDGQKGKNAHLPQFIKSRFAHLAG